jgi:hypothetical protein
MSHKAIAASLALTFCLALALAAQSPSTEPGGKGKEVSLTGCLHAGAEPNSYILKNTGMQAAAGSEAKPAELAKADTEYKLIGDANVKLKDHVGQKVEVTGMITGRTQDQPGGAGAMSQVKVKSIKEVSATCP